MAMSDAEVQSQLAALLTQAHKRKNTVLSWFAIGGLLLSLFACGETQSILTEGFDWGNVGAFIVALVAGIVVFGCIMYVDDLLNARRAQKTAQKFRDMFSGDPDDYQSALALLHTAKSEQKIENDLLKALGFEKDVTFTSGAASQAGTIKSTPGVARYGAGEPAGQARAPNTG